MTSKIVVNVEPERKKIPPYTQAYKLVFSILKHSKLKNIRRVMVKLTRLCHNSEALSVKDVRVFTEFVKYYTQSGKFRKNSYKNILKQGKLALHKLAPMVDIEHNNTKQTRADRTIGKLDAVIEAPFSPKPEKVEGKRVRRTRIVDTELKDDDEMFLKSVYKSDKETLNSGEHGIIRRAIIFMNTMIPQQILRPIQIEYGIQRISSYLMASHAQVLGVPLFSDDAEPLSRDECAQQAKDILRMRNKINSKRGLVKLGMFGHPVTTSDHLFWLLLPETVLNDANVRITRWDFSQRPKANHSGFSVMHD